MFKGALSTLAANVIDEVVECADLGVSWRELLKPPRSGHYDIVVATEPKVRNALLLKRISHRLFISPAANFRFSDRQPRADMPYPDSVYEQLRCLGELAAGRKLQIKPVIDVGAANERLAKQLLPDGKRYLGLAPGSAGESKRWPLRRYIDLAKAHGSNDLTPVFFLGPEEISMYEEIARAVPQALFPEQVAGSRNLGGALFSIALAQRIAVGVANDAGGGHLLAAGCRPLITLFGHTSEQKFKPPYGRRIAINARDYGGTDMSLIPVDRVAVEINLLLQMTASC
ncbi:MAG: lipopolysaccharide heptosyltransferase family protein [Proteobacteria bacterium]|nr:lipopolysaccharide heptosyltransferase family protein [Pseudomonadota bacterium]